MEALILFVTQFGKLCTAVASTAPAVIGAASVIAAFLPPPENEGKAAKLHRIVNRLAFNFYHAQNAK